MKVDSQLREGDDTGTILWNKLFHFLGSHREDFLSLYHQRSNAETTVSMIKTRFQEHVCSRHPVAQVNEVLAKILCHNICQVNRMAHEWGVPFSAWE